jgi:hypothetical protein
VLGPYFKSPSASVFALGSSTNTHKLIEMAHRFNIEYQALLISKIRSYNSQGSNGIAMGITYPARFYYRKAAIYY